MRKVAVHGATGRMGRAVTRVTTESDDVELVAALASANSAHLGTDAGELSGVGRIGVAISSDLAALQGADVVIDFSLPKALPALFEACRRHATPAVVATTGLGAAELDLLAQLEAEQPVVFAPNYSTGVTALFHLASVASRMLGDFDAEVVEMHHRHKVDAPSGTALKLADAAAQARGQSLAEDGVFERHGQVGPRRDGEIGVMTLRGGDVVGEHTLVLAGPGERVEISHRATDRGIFARGALRAARWVLDKGPGRYTMAQVLGI